MLVAATHIVGNGRNHMNVFSASMHESSMEDAQKHKATNTEVTHDHTAQVRITLVHRLGLAHRPRNRRALDWAHLDSIVESALR